MTKTTLNWGIIGNSDIARKRVAPAIAAQPQSRLLSIYSRSQERAEQFCRDHGTERPYSDPAAFLADPDLDAVYISSELYRHCEETVACAAAGKHVLVEKPMAMNPEECEQMIAACRDAGVGLAVAFYRRYHPKLRLMKQLIEEGAIGKPLAARIAVSGSYNPSPDDPKYWRVVPGKGGGGNIQDMGSHWFDLLAFLLGDAESAAGVADTLVHSYAADDTAVGLVRMRNGAQVTAHFAWSMTGSMTCFEIHGSEGMLNAHPVEGPRLVLKNRAGEQVWDDLTMAENVQYPLIEDYTQRVLAGERPTYTGEDGARATRIISAILRSSESGRFEAV